MKEVTWSSGGLVLFIVKKIQLEKTFLEAALLWHSTPTREETEKESEIFSSSLSLFCDCCLLTRARENASVRKRQ